MLAGCHSLQTRKVETRSSILLCSKKLVLLCVWWSSLFREKLVV